MCRVPDETFDFLGYTLWSLLLDRGRDELYLGPRPSKKRSTTVCRADPRGDEPKVGWRDAEEQVGRLNRI